MATIDVKCPYCGKTNVIKSGRGRNNIQRYMCRNSECSAKTFMLEYRNTGCEPGIETKIIKMTSNASGIRDTSRVLGISTQKVIDTLKKQKRP